MDYAAWTRRASSFLRSLTHLPGEIELDDGIESPGTDDHTQDWLRSDQCSLPPELKLFVATATRHCYFRYRWKPPQNLHAVLAELFPGREELFGGADFCNSYGFSNYDNRDWFQHELPPLMEKTSASVAPLFPPEFAALSSMSVRAIMESSMKGAGVTDDERVNGRVALLALEGGAKISLEFSVRDGTRPVIYVTPIDPAKRHVISTSFDQFLSDWEQLCYITPNLENLAPWLDLANGRLNPNNSKTRLLRGILTTVAHGGKE